MLLADGSVNATGAFAFDDTVDVTGDLTAVADALQGIGLFPAGAINIALPTDLSGIDTLGKLNANFTDGTVLPDQNHTHTEADITDLQNYVVEGDSRLTDARPPTAHTHVLADLTDLGSLQIDHSQVQNVPDFLLATDLDTRVEVNALIPGTTFVFGDDSRLTDARVPTAHTHSEADILDLQDYVVEGDPRLTDSRDPNAHTHTEADISDLKNYVLPDGSVAFTAPIAGVAPTDDTHLVTRGHLNAVVGGLDYLTAENVDTLVELNALLVDEDIPSATAFNAHLALTTGAHGMSSFGSGFVAAANSAAARGALGLGSAATTSSGDYATAAQGTRADTSIQNADLNSKAKIDALVLDGTFVWDDDARLADAPREDNATRSPLGSCVADKSTPCVLVDTCSMLKVSCRT